jgi:hypothetical protein
VLWILLGRDGFSTGEMVVVVALTIFAALFLLARVVVNRP